MALINREELIAELQARYSYCANEQARNAFESVIKIVNRMPAVATAQGNSVKRFKKCSDCKFCGSPHYNRDMGYCERWEKYIPDTLCGCDEDEHGNVTLYNFGSMGK